MFLVGSKSNVSAVFWLRFRMVWALYFFLFSGFQKRRFRIFLAAVSQWLGHKTCWGSAFSHALVFSRFQKQRFGSFSGCGFAWFGHYTSFFLVGSKSDVSAFFRLRFRNGLGTKPAGVLPFRMRVPNTKGLEYPRNLSSVTKPLFRPSAPNFAVSSVRGRRHGRQPFNN